MSNNVKTVSGKTVPREAAKDIKGLFHEENVDCFKINGRWYRINCGLIGFNMDMKKWFILKEIDSFNFQNKVIIDYNFEGNPVYGYTVARRELFIPIKTKEGEVLAANQKVAERKYVINPHLGIFSDSTSKMPGSPLNPQDFPYSLKDYGLKPASYEEITKTIGNPRTFYAYLSKLYHDINDTKGSSNLAKQYNSVLGKITFGIEAESCNPGLSNLALIARSGLVCLRDGSVKGYEVVSHPHKGFGGLLATATQFSTVEPVFNFDQSCSIHIHVAGHTLSDLQLFALFCLCNRLQDEIFEFVHPYKRNIDYLKTLKHEYSEPLKSLNVVYNKGIVDQNDKINIDAFQKAFTTFCKFITIGAATKIQDVYQDTAKYRINSRYSWVNFVNFLKDRSATLEFRCFPPSFNGPTIAVWAAICKAIYHYGVHNANRILSDGFHAKMDDVFLFLLDGLERENNAEFFNYVDALRRIFQKVTDKYSNNYINRDVVYSSYVTDYKDSCSIFKGILPHLGTDLKNFEFEDPAPLKELISYKK